MLDAWVRFPIQTSFKSWIHHCGHFIMYLLIAVPDEFLIRVCLHQTESENERESESENDIASRLFHGKYNLMFILSSNKDSLSRSLSLSVNGL